VFPEHRQPPSEYPDLRRHEHISSARRRLDTSSQPVEMGPGVAGEGSGLTPVGAGDGTAAGTSSTGAGVKAGLPGSGAGTGAMQAW